MLVARTIVNAKGITMKKWICTLICLGYLSPSFATDHTSFLVTGEDLQEMSYYDHVLEAPNFFSRVYPQNLNPNLVLIPRINSGFEFGVVGYYQRPYDNQLDYGISEVGSPPFFLVSPGSSIHSVDPDYEFAYGAYLGYVYPYSGRDIRLDLFNFSGTSNEAVNATGTGTVWTPLALYDFTTIANNAITRLDIDIEQAKLMVGQRVFGGTRFHLRPSLGVKYAAINRELDTYYPLSTSPLFEPALFNAYVEQKSRISGVGPAVQLDGSYFFTPSFGLIGHLTTAILIGNVRSEIRYTNDNLPEDSTQISLPSTNRTVPNIDGQLGITFRHLFCGTHTTLEMELGYEFNHFFNAVDSYRSAGFAPFSITHIKNVHDLTLDGPYLSIGLSGIACPDDVVIDPIVVTVPRMDGGFIFGLGAGYFRVAHNQMDYALLDPTALSFLGEPGPVPTLNATLKDVNLNNAYGGMFTAGYIFRHSPYDIVVHYRETVSNDSSTTIAPSTGVIWTILSVPPLNPLIAHSHATEAKARANFNYHDANIEFGQTIAAPPFILLRLFGGVQYASINTNLHTTYNNVSLFISDLLPSLVIPQEDIVQKSDFTGIGPRIGFDMTLPIRGFALSSQLAGGVLIGSIDSSYKDEFPDTVLPGSDFIPGAAIGVRTDSETQASPYLNLKVGLAYTFNFFSNTKWTLDIGYMAIHYFNAATSFRHATNTPGIFVKQVHDITVEGPYLNLTVFGFGACPPDCIIREPYTVFAPVLRGGFEFAVEGLYLQPHVSNLDYGIADPLPMVIDQGLPFDLSPSPHSHMRVLTPQYEFGYRLHLGYIFPLTANDVSINFADLKGSTSRITNADPGGVIWTITNGNYSAALGNLGILPDAPLLPFAAIANRAEASADFTWQTGNLEFGRRLKFYQLMTRFFAGLSYARIIEDMDIIYTDGQSLIVDEPPFLGLPIASDTLEQNNSFYGFGPRLGFSADLNIGCGFSFVGQVGTDLLIGNIDSKLFESSSAGVSTTLNPDHRTRLVPALDAKLGFAFTIPFRNCSQIGIELGYQVNHYFNAKDSLRFTDSFSTFIKQDQDISFDGPYARIQVDI